MVLYLNTLIIETLSAHFSSLTQGPPVKGIKIGEPRLSLALAAAAVSFRFLHKAALIFDWWQVEHALQLFVNEMVQEQVDAKEKWKFVIQKSHNPDTGIHLRFLTEFSAAGWNFNQVTIDYLDSVNGLGDKLKLVLNEANDFAKKGKKQEEFSKPKSICSALHSDDKYEHDPEPAVASTKIWLFF